MAKALYREGHLKDIGDAIRAQLGVTTRYLPTQMAAAVLSISSGGASQSFTPHDPGDEVLVEEAHMTALANAIRSKLGVTTRYLPGQMAAAIRSIAPAARTLVSIAITTLPQTEYEPGDALDLTGIVVTATYDDSSTANVTALCTFTPPDGEIYLAAGLYTVTASYTEGGVTKTTSFQIVVSDSNATLLIFAITSSLTQKLYFTQSAANGVTINWGDGSATETVAATSAQASHTYAAAGNYAVKLTAGEGVTWSPGATISNSSYCFLGSYTVGKAASYPTLTKAFLRDMSPTLRQAAFANCTGLTEVAIGQGVTKLDPYAFLNTTALASVHLPSGLLTFDGYVFQNSGLRSISIPNTVTDCGNGTFASCTSLVTAEINGKLIGTAYIFGGCTALQKAWLRSTVTKIETTRPFDRCTGVTLYCEAASKPEEWETFWNYTDANGTEAPVVWGQTTRPW